MTLDDLIDEIISITSDEYEKCVFFMIKCLSLIVKVCPEIGIQGINTATRYWIEKSIDQAELEKARVECWDYLDVNSASTNIVESKFCAVRAVICVLYSEPPSEDNGELLDWFFKMLTSVDTNTDSLFKDVLAILEDFKTKV
jgi:hypothetical protein